MDSEIEVWARRLGQVLQDNRMLAATAESCTGGGVAYAITEISGSSAWFDRAFITYSNEAKIQMLGVDAALLTAHGAVSGEVVTAMLQGVFIHSDADLAVAISGIAGPTGGSPEKPVGTVWIGWALKAQPGAGSISCFHFAGDRHQVRQQAILAALQGMCKLIQ